ncbi:MAG: 1,2-phenylacetyl-CoA epoxidase subunit PaaC [Chloroflexota bacterium]
MKADLQEALAHKLLALADDELILGHRDSEWTGHAPILEEDIAFANIALDELGHAKTWYCLLADLIGEDRETYPDRLVFFREAADYRHLQMVELPKGDWAFTIVRQYLFDAAEVTRLEQGAQSKHQPVAEAAAKIRQEELYHYRHTQAWLKRLGLAMEESRRRMQNALNQLWPYAAQLFVPLPGESLLVQAGFVPAPERLRSAWEQLVLPQLAQADLTIPVNAAAITVQRDRHTPHLAALLAELQEVARLNPGAAW